LGGKKGIRTIKNRDMTGGDGRYGTGTSVIAGGVLFSKSRKTSKRGVREKGRG